MTSPQNGGEFAVGVNSCSLDAVTEPIIYEFVRVLASRAPKYAVAAFNIKAARRADRLARTNAVFELSRGRSPARSCGLVQAVMTSAEGLCK